MTQSTKIIFHLIKKKVFLLTFKFVLKVEIGLAASYYKVSHSFRFDQQIFIRPIVENFIFHSVLISKCLSFNKQ